MRKIWLFKELRIKNGFKIDLDGSNNVFLFIYLFIIIIIM